MTRFEAAGLYVVLTGAFCGGRRTLDVLRAVLDGGATLVQLREKDVPVREYLRMAREARRLTERADALLIVNDRLDVALAAGADGVHLGQDDLPVEAARAAAPNLIVGASTHSVEEAQTARNAGASYINIGPLFATATKTLSTPPLGLDGLRRIAGAIDLPFTVMGGIKRRHVPDLVAAGARTLAMVTAITADPRPAQAAAHMLTAIRQAVRPRSAAALSESRKDAFAG